MFRLRAIAQMNDIGEFWEKVLWWEQHHSDGWHSVIYRIAEAIYAFAKPATRILGVPTTRVIVEGVLSKPTIHRVRGMIVKQVNRWIDRDRNERERIGIRRGHFRIYTSPMDRIRHQTLRQRDLDLRQIFHKYSQEERREMIALLTSAYQELPACRYPIIDDQIPGYLPEEECVIPPIIRDGINANPPSYNYSDIIQHTTKFTPLYYHSVYKIVLINGLPYRLVAKNSFNEMWNYIIDEANYPLGTRRVEYKMVPDGDFLFEVLLFWGPENQIMNAYVKEYVYE